MGSRRWLHHAVVAAWLCLAGFAHAEAPPRDCGAPLLRIEHLHAVDLDHAGEAWRRVARFLLDGQGLRVLGHNHRVAGVVRVTSMTAEWLREPDRLMFRQPVDAELHVSLIVHELAHAILKDNYRNVPQPSLVCDEYVAYVVQFATMQPETRARVLAGYPQGDFASRDEITQICVMMTPHEFGVRAWRHRAREGHRDMLQDILSGRFRPEEYPF